MAMCLSSIIRVMLRIASVVVALLGILRNRHVRSYRYSMSQKNVSNIVQCNTVSFSKNEHETGAQRYPTTSQTVSIPFLFVSYRSGVPRGVEMLLFSSKKDCLAGAPVASQPRFSRSWLPLGYEEKSREAFLESGRSPTRAMASPSDDLRSIVKARA